MRTWRQLLVWLHVLTSLTWMSTALGLVVLFALSRDDPARAAAAVDMAHVLDMTLLAPAANASAVTGVLLALATRWGLLRHRWVAAKFAITLVQLYVGIGILSVQLRAVDAGDAPAPGWMAAAAACMVGALAFQAWLSIAKPWSTLGIATRPAPPTAGPGWFAAGVLATVGDLVLSQVLGFPSPVFAVPTLLGAIVWLRLVGALSPAPAGRSPGSRSSRAAGRRTPAPPRTASPAGARSAASAPPADPPRHR